MQRADLAHHGLVDAQAAGRVQDQHVVVMAACVVDRVAGDVLGLLAGVGRQEVHADLRGHGLQLLDGGGTVDVGRHHQHFLLAGLAAVLSVLALGQPARQLAGGGGLARALQAGHQDHGGRLHGQRQFAGVGAQVAAHQRGQFLVDHADQGLAGAEAAGDFFAQRLVLTRATNSRTTGSATSASSRAMRTSRSISWVLAPVRRFAAQRLDDARQALS